MKDQLVASLNIVVANTWILYFKAHTYHWNVEGKDFSQLHSFFGDLYEETFDAVDVAAEQLRALDEYAPVSTKELIEFSTIEEDEEKPSSVYAMLSNLVEANGKTIDSLNKLCELATEHKNQGLLNFAADRLDKHAKHGWMLKAHLKG